MYINFEYVFVLWFFNIITCNNEFIVKTIKQPDNCDKISKIGDLIRIHYTIKDVEGTQIYSTQDSHPIEIKLGNVHMFSQFEKGLISMCIGEHRQLTIPPNLLSLKDFHISDDETLIFTFNLLNIIDASQNNIFSDIDTDNDNVLSQDEVSDFIRRQEEGIGEIPTENDHNSLIADIFIKEDSNKDGYLSRDEFLHTNHEEL